MGWKATFGQGCGGDEKTVERSRMKLGGGVKWEGQKGQKAEIQRMETWGKQTRQEGKWSPGQRIKK